MHAGYALFSPTLLREQGSHTGVSCTLGQIERISLCRLFLSPVSPSFLPPPVCPRDWPWVSPPVSPLWSLPTTTFPPPFSLLSFRGLSFSFASPTPCLPPPPSAFCFHSGSPRSAATSCWALGCCGWVACGYGPPPTQAWPLVSGCRASASFVVIISSCAQRLALVPLLRRTWCIYDVYRRSVSRGVDRAKGWPRASTRVDPFLFGDSHGKE
jgi:hypothetical protein